MAKKYRIAHVGTFDVENYGDLLFPTVLKHNFLDYEIDLFSPIGGGQFLPNKEDVFSIKDLEKKHLENRYDAIVIGGGNLIRTDSVVAYTYEKSNDVSLSLWALPTLIGKKYNIPVLYNCPGVLRQFKRCEREVIKEIFKDVDYISVRDEDSKLLLEECGVSSVKVVPDTVLSIDNIIKYEDTKRIKKQLEKDKKIPKLENYIVIQHIRFNLDDEHYVNELKKLMNIIIEEYNYNILLLPIGYVHFDIEAMEKLNDLENENIKMIKNKLNPLEMLSVIANSCGYIGTSMHGEVTAYAYGKPILMINTDNMVKRSGLVKIINRENIEVNNIDELIEIFKEHFFDEVNKDDKNEINKKIKTHFKNIRDIIESGKRKNYFNVEFDILKSAFNGFELKGEVYDTISVYLDNGCGYSEELKKEIKVDNCNKIKFNMSFSDEVRQIRIDPFEGVIVKVNKIEIKSNDKILDYKIPDMYLDKYILSVDPNIYVDIDSSVKDIDVEMDIKNKDNVDNNRSIIRKIFKR